MMKQGERTVRDDRREYFRVNDAVRVSISPVPVDQVDRLEERLEEKTVSGFTVMSSLAAISSEMTISMRRIENSDPDVATYLKALDHKIEVLGKALIAQESQLVEEPAHTVNLSAGGMSMLVNEAYHPGQVLEVKMLLFPSVTGVLMYGSVVECTPIDTEADDAGYTYRLRLAFTFMREQDRDLLIRHVLRCQSHALRKSDPLERDKGETP